MALATEQKSEVIKNYQINDRDTGSAPVQVAILTTRINELQTHFKAHKQDHHSRLGLLKMVGKRRRLPDYITSSDINPYRVIIKKSNLRKSLT